VLADTWHHLNLLLMKVGLAASLQTGLCCTSLSLACVQVGQQMVNTEVV
jgi:hypothetical protein